MASRDAKLRAMDAAERERRDAMVHAALLTPMQMAARQRSNGGLDRIKSYLSAPFRPEVQAAGISRAREALEGGRVQGRERERR